MPDLPFEIYATDLDKFRRHLQSEDTADADFLDELDCGPPPSAMRRIIFGSYIHALAEYQLAPTRSSLEEVQCAQSQVHMWHEKECRHEIHDMPYEVHDLPAVDACELQARLTVDTDHGPVRVRGRIDAIRGGIAYDWKVSSQPKASVVAESMQHRAYFAAMPEIVTFKYHFYKADIPSPASLRPTYKIDYWGCYQIERQPENSDLHAVASLVREFREFAAASGWRGRGPPAD